MADLTVPLRKDEWLQAIPRVDTVEIWFQAKGGSKICLALNSHDLDALIPALVAAKTQLHRNQRVLEIKRGLYGVRDAAAEET